jgi:hypothetical protein
MQHGAAQGNCTHTILDSALYHQATLAATVAACGNGEKHVDTTVDGGGWEGVGAVEMAAIGP